VTIACGDAGDDRQGPVMPGDKESLKRNPLATEDPAMARERYVDE
jgi:hypothetical protein